MRHSSVHFHRAMVRMTRYQQRQINSCCFAVAKKSYQGYTTKFSPINASCMSSFASDHQKFVPPSTVEKISLLQEHFNSLTTENGAMELYDSATLERMWQSVLLRKKKGAKTEETSPPDIITSSLKDDNDVATTDTGNTVKTAGVLVLFVLVNGTDFSVVLTRRSKHLSQHASEISFAGGHFDAQMDHSLVDTAVREAVEELYGCSPADASQCQQEFRKHLHVFGTASAVPSLRGTSVTPVLAVYAATNDDPSPVLTSEFLMRLWPGNRDEVDVVFTVPVETLMKQHDGAEKTTTDHRFEPCETDQLPKKSTTKVPPQYSTSFGSIWGLTAYILQPIVDKLLIPVLRQTTTTVAAAKFSS